MHEGSGTGVRRELELLQRIADAANESETMEEALRVALYEVCSHTGWPVGHVWVPSGAPQCDLVPTGMWYLDDPERFDAFRALTESSRLPWGVGLPGRVFLSRRAAWIRDVTTDPSFPRAKASRDIGLRSGFAFPVLSEGEVLAVLEFFSPDVVEPGPGFLEDVSHIGKQLARVAERRRAETVLRESEERFRAVFETGPIGMTLVGRDLRILQANAALERMLGYGRDGLIGLTIMDITHPADAARTEEDARKLFRGDVDRYAIEKRYLTRGGDTVWGLLTASVIHVPEGRSPLALGMIQDITERKSLEEQLRQSQKMEAVGRLAGGVAHDFNNLLTVITGCSELLLGKFRPEDPLRPHLLEIHQAAGRAAGLTRQLLAFSRQQVLQPRVVDLNGVVAGMDQLLRRLIGEDVEFVTRLDPDLGRVRIDPSQVEQIIMNLVVNARDALPRGGRITVRTTNAELDEADARRHLTVGPGAHVVLAVSDTGCGMDSATQARIFEPFFTTKGLGEGTGLGLSTVYGIIKQSGGDIRVESTPGRGTTFECWFPRVQESLGAVAVHSTDTPARGRETILLAEDDDVVRRVIGMVLEQGGYTVLQAASGLEALELSERHSGEIELLVTDLVMPGMDGRELVDRLSGLRTGIRILFTSGYTDDAVIRERALAPGTAFMQKPYATQALLRKIRELLDAPL
jgi:PAS domain S-box-containing protein